MADFRTNAGGPGTVVDQEGDAYPGLLYSVDFTLGTANTVSVFDIPTGANGFRVYANSAALRWNLNAAPPSTNATGSGVGPVDMASGNAYNLVPASSTSYVRNFDAVTVPTTLQINSGTGSATFTLEFF